MKSLTTSWQLVAILLMLSLTGSVAFAADAPSQAKTAVKSVVPFEMLVTNHMVVRAKLNGKGPYRLIFDLGAPITLLSNSASESSGVIKKNAPRSFLFAMRGEATVPTLEVGQLKAKNLPVIVLDHPALKVLGNLLGRPLDGIIGFTFFARYKTTIDYQAKQMTFEPVDYEVRNLLRELPDRLAGPKVAKRRVLVPAGVFGLKVTEPANPLTAAGVTIASVVPDSPAATAGLKVGDILTTLDGRWTTSVSDTFAAAKDAVAGKAVGVVVLRDGKELTLSLTPLEGF